jgi:hypothetical protein
VSALPVKEQRQLTVTSIVLRQNGYVDINLFFVKTDLFDEGCSLLATDSGFGGIDTYLYQPQVIVIPIRPYPSR